MRTTTFTVNNVSDPEPIIVGSFCREVRIQEDPGIGSTWPTTDYNVYGTGDVSTAVRKIAGTTFTITRVPLQGCFAPGEIVGYIETVAGSTTFLQIES
jgi:hypothetical protein